jgi:DNA-directed RNA polymerase subunit omega
MARISIEDCLENVDNRFELVLIAAKRSKQLLKGNEKLIDNKDDNKDIVMSLREIAAGKVNKED